MGHFHKAAAVLEKQAKSRPRDPDVWYLLAESQGKAGNILGVHLARAEYFLLNGLPGRATQQLSFALKMENLDNLTKIRITERMNQMKQLQTALEGF
jgi:predicted Zn-dependent protease